MEIASLVWDITKANVSWGRVRIANQLALLKIFISGSTVRNILNRPQPPKQPVSHSKPEKTEDEKAKTITIQAIRSNSIKTLYKKKLKSGQELEDAEVKPYVVNLIRAYVGDVE